METGKTTVSTNETNQATAISGLIEKVFLRGTITALTGLRIGGNDQGLSVGGVQNVVVRHALLNEPYVPGSSLRGKLRCSLERLVGVAGEGHGQMITFGPYDDPTHHIVQLFGCAAKEGAAIPSRVLVRDCLLTKDSRRLLRALRSDLPMTETKTEVCIDRVTSAANPRIFERVPAGAEFDLEIVLEVRALPEKLPETASAELKTMIEAQKKHRSTPSWGRDEDLKWLFTGLDLLQSDALGGQGSRGYGRVKIQLDPPSVRTKQSYLDSAPATVLTLEADLQRRFDGLNQHGHDELQEIRTRLPPVRA